MNAFEKISNEEMMCIDGGFNPGVILPGVAAVCKLSPLSRTF